MSRFHYLNVNDGDCSIIQHNSDRVTVFDCCNARLAEPANEAAAILKRMDGAFGGLGNFNQKAYPVNPIAYMRSHGIADVFRFILSHPEMDHMDGIKDFFSAFSPVNFWDIDNDCEKDFSGWNRYREEDWQFYKKLRAGQVSTERRVYHSGDRARYFNVNEDGTSGADGLHILAPTPALAADAKKCGQYNDGSYVILYKAGGGRVLLCGDIHDKSMDHVIATHSADVANLDLLIAPHHGRDSSRSFDFLNVMRPKMTFFGNASSDHLAYNAWSSRGLPIMTNNQADCMVVETGMPGMPLYVTNENYARRENSSTFYSKPHQAWFVRFINDGWRQAA